MVDDSRGNTPQKDTGALADDLAAMAAAVAQAVAEQEEQAGGSERGGGSDQPDNSDDKKEEPPLPPGMPQPATSALVRQCIDANERGDGYLYTAMHRQNYLFNKSADSWLAWTGHYWQLDEMTFALASVEDVVERYQEEAGELSLEIKKLGGELAVDESDSGAGDSAVSQKKLKYLQEMRKQMNKRAQKLSAENGRQACLKFARTNRAPLAVVGSALDQQPMLLPCVNGVVDLTTGEHRQGNQSDLLTLATETEWLGLEAPAPLWEKTLAEIFDNNLPLIKYLQRLFGYGITGQVTEHIFPVFIGRGRNGKSLITDTIREVLGALAAPIRPELLLEQSKNRSAAAPSPDVMRLCGLRIAFAEETDEGSRFSSSRVKNFTGGAELSGRNPNDKFETSFKPTHLLILSTNSRPKAPGTDYAFWARIRIINFLISFVSNPVADHERLINKDLGKQLLTPSERSGILAWLVRGCLDWQRDGLNPPPEVLAAGKEAQIEDDLVGEFIDECLTVEGGTSVRATELYNLFKNWFHITQGKREPSQKWFGGQLTGRNVDKRKSNGIYKYFGLTIDYGASADYTYAEKE